MHSLFLYLIASNSRKPNVIYIMTDQWRSTAFGYSGNPTVKTPNLDDFSKDAINFENAVLFISLATPHFPHHTSPQSYKDMYPSDELVLRDSVVGGKFPALREELGYYAHCTATDKAIGELLNKIESLGFYENSIIIFSADHGEMMGSHGIRPKQKQMAWDVLPTMLGLTGIEIPSQIEGDDLSAVVKDPKRQQDRAALFMSVRPFAKAMFTEYCGIRTSQYSYVKTPGQATMLFDNIADPYQMNNLVNRPEARELQAKLDRSLTMELEKIGDENFKDGGYYMEKWGCIGDSRWEY